LRENTAGRQPQLQRPKNFRKKLYV